MKAAKCLLSSSSSLDIAGIVIEGPLLVCDAADQAQGGSADLAGPLRHWVGHGEDLGGMFVEHPVIVAEMRPADMPMEVLGVEVKHEAVREERDQRHCDLVSGF
jgi:hypothetical protein